MKILRMIMTAPLWVPLMAAALLTFHFNPFVTQWLVLTAMQISGEE